ncbi:helix-turn-helix domain-containing protein [Desertimonas flava]|uniref:helix-turn-helix domain-containing protein n=1 Tax=Desertimonas flava TaxID=2064846 RepID=UPI0013C4985D|nr:helix-turn-helix domain-containing protein [Desertimonas flava]
MFGDRRNPGLNKPTGGRRLVLLSLANHANDEGWCFPSIATISREAGLSERRCHDAIRWLLAEGYIDRTINGAPKEMVGQYRSNLYLLNADAEAGVDSPSMAESSGVDESSQDALALRGGRSDTPGVDESSEQGWTERPQEPSPEPSGEPSPEPMVAAEAASEEQPTANQVTKRVVDDYWEFVRKETGKVPVGITHVALQNVVRPFIEAGYGVAEVKRAMAAVRERGQTFTRQIVEQHLDGRASQPKANRTTTVTDVARGAQDAAARYEAEEMTACHRHSA